MEKPFNLNQQEAEIVLRVAKIVAPNLTRKGIVYDQVNGVHAKLLYPQSGHLLIGQGISPPIGRTKPHHKRILGYVA